MNFLFNTAKKLIGIKKKDSNVEMLTYVPSEKVVYMLTHFSDPFKRLDGCPIVEKLEEVEYMKNYVETMGISGLKIVEIAECELYIRD